MLMETCQISNLMSQDVSKEIRSDLVLIRFDQKNVVEFSDKFFHLQYGTRKMCKGALNNYSMLKLRFLISIYTFEMYSINVSH